MKNNLLIGFCVICLFLFAGILIAMAIVPLGSIASVTASSHNWYYKPNEEGLQPIVSDDAAFLSDYDILFMGNSQDKYLYLTFDAGFDNGNTAVILDVLKEKGVCAAFFLTGHFMKSQPELLKRMENEGHIVGNHTVDHKDLTSCTEEVFLEQVAGLETIYQETTGAEMSKFLRPPEGKYSESFLKLCEKNGYIPVFWSFAYKDWLEDDQPTRENALGIITKRTHNGAVLLLHSTSSTNAAVLGELIDTWRSEGYEIKSLNDLYTEVTSTKK